MGFQNRDNIAAGIKQNVIVVMNHKECRRSLLKMLDIDQVGVPLMTSGNLSLFVL